MINFIQLLYWTAKKAWKTGGFLNFCRTFPKAALGNRWIASTPSADRINGERPRMQFRIDRIFLVEIFLSQAVVKVFANIDGLSPVDLCVSALALVDCGLNPWTRTRFQT